MRESIRAMFDQFHATGIPVASGRIDDFFIDQPNTAHAVSLFDLAEYAASAGCLDDPSLVYFIARNDGCIKIGVSRHPGTRADRIEQTLVAAGVRSRVHIIALLRGGRTIEAYLHRAFRDLRIAGEWFSPGASLISLITEIRTAREEVAREGGK